MARSKITDRIRLFVWFVMAIITAPFALVLAFSSWLQDLVAGDQFPRLRWEVQKAEYAKKYGWPPTTEEKKDD